MGRRRRPPTLQEAARADVEQGEAHWEREDDLRPWDVKLVRHAKRWTKVAASVTGFVTALSAFAGGVVKAVRWVRAGGSTPAAELPATGQPTIAPDFVQKSPPKP